MRQRHSAFLLVGFVAALACASGEGVADPLRAGNGTLVQRFHPPKAKEGYTYPECYCTDSKGGRVEMGERACLTVGERQFTARCDMSLNNPVWRQEAEGCPTA